MAEFPSFVSIPLLAASFHGGAAWRKGDEWATASLGLSIARVYFGEQTWVHTPERPPSTSDNWTERTACDLVTQQHYLTRDNRPHLHDPCIFWEWKKYDAGPSLIEACEKQIDRALKKGIAPGKEGYGVCIIGGMIRIFKRWNNGAIACITGNGPASTDSYLDITSPTDALALDSIFRDIRQVYQ